MTSDERDDLLDFLRRKQCAPCRNGEEGGQDTLDASKRSRSHRGEGSPPTLGATPAAVTAGAFTIPQFLR
jgi:hypothetical protein